MKKNETDYTIKSVERAFKVLESFKEEPELGISELSKKLKMPKSTIYYVLATLKQMKYIEQKNNNKYQLGIKALELGSIMLNRMELRTVARPVLKKLVAKSSEAVHLVVLDENEIVYIDKIEGLEAIQIKSKLGGRLPAYCTGVGKAILAYLSEEEIDNYINTTTLKKFTDNTITEPDALKIELKKIRERGYSVDEEEFNEGLKCIAAPIKDHTGNVIAATSISGPAKRISKKNENNQLINLVKSCSEEISLNLGFIPPK